ncbi:uncharacterized protein B0H18DRAFT_1017058 [Fomitopsis serialis]|uniref:uncharacterized protein n=1 Tax=Fomitopsis serialis TaxID=139415 RepID=UPI002007321E|nr:uncharacterized protein B0H18DRAFT_1017058 [Neoantrodia serialis]KAH9922612.1 hypothetical protein B0H18DRAFT_1017058 [Neoantrodia serialis]
MSAAEPTEPTRSQTEVEDNQSERPYAILRIKRKRNEEPLDALLVDQDVARPKGKRSRAGLNFFKFAETVEQGAWDDEQAKKDLETRLAALARESRQGGERDQTQQAEIPASKSAPADMGQPAPATAAGSVTAEATVATPPPTKRRRADHTPRKYTILRREVPSTDPPVRRRMPSAPPKVWSMRELEAARAAQARLAMYEAVPSTSGVEASDSVDADIAKFLPLLQDYLKLEDPVAVPATSAAPPAREDDTDYVYDVFYQRLTRDPSAIYGNVGTLTGVPDELIMYDSDDDNDSEVYDTADEDSNAEDWYQNDYPDEESDRDDDGSEGSDVFHESSDHEDMMYDDDDDEHEWR